MHRRIKQKTDEIERQKKIKLRDACRRDQWKEWVNHWVKANIEEVLIGPGSLRECPWRRCCDNEKWYLTSLKNQR